VKINPYISHLPLESGSTTSHACHGSERENSHACHGSERERTVPQARGLALLALPLATAAAATVPSSLLTIISPDTPTMAWYPLLRRLTNQIILSPLSLLFSLPSSQTAAATDPIHTRFHCITHQSPQTVKPHTPIKSHRQKRREREEEDEREQQILLKYSINRIASSSPAIACRLSTHVHHHHARPCLLVRCRVKSSC
jgi:hypothetical protein